jgi:hypothetical protein
MANFVLEIVNANSADMDTVMAVMSVEKER